VPSPGADVVLVNPVEVAGISPVLVQIWEGLGQVLEQVWQRCAQSLSRRGRRVPSPGADVATVRPFPVHRPNDTTLIRVRVRLKLSLVFTCVRLFVSIKNDPKMSRMCGRRFFGKHITITTSITTPLNDIPHATLISHDERPGGVTERTTAWTKPSNGSSQLDSARPGVISNAHPFKSQTIGASRSFLSVGTKQQSSRLKYSTVTLIG
jgi:hypothetical protein